MSALDEFTQREGIVEKRACALLTRALENSLTCKTMVIIERNNRFVKRVCTLKKGHPGDHHAHLPWNECVYTWPKSEREQKYSAYAGECTGENNG